jgi:hypothetical protein
MSLARIIHLPALVAVLAVTASLAATASASAQSSAELRHASDRYRDAAREFDRYVNRAGYFSRFDERLADRLEEMARDFRSAARNPRDVERLIYHWNDLTATHIRVEETLIRGCGRPDPTLLHLWREVTRSYAYVASEMQCFTGGHASHRFPSDWDRAPVHLRTAPGRFQHDDFHYDSIPYGHRGGNLNFSSNGRQVTPRAEVGAVIAATLLNRLLN